MALLIVRQTPSKLPEVFFKQHPFCISMTMRAFFIASPFELNYQKPSIAGGEILSGPFYEQRF